MVNAVKGSNLERKCGSPPLLFVSQELLSRFGGIESSRGCDLAWFGSVWVLIWPPLCDYAMGATLGFLDEVKTVV